MRVAATGRQTGLAVSRWAERVRGSSRKACRSSLAAAIYTVFICGRKSPFRSHREANRGGHEQGNERGFGNEDRNRSPAGRDETLERCLGAKRRNCGDEAP